MKCISQVQLVFWITTHWRTVYECIV